MIINKTPLRLSLSGGGSDIPVYFNKIPSNVLNFSLNLFITTIIKKNNINKTLFINLDYEEKKKPNFKHDKKMALNIFNFFCNKYKIIEL